MSSINNYYNIFFFFNSIVNLQKGYITNTLTLFLNFSNTHTTGITFPFSILFEHMIFVILNFLYYFKSIK